VVVGLVKSMAKHPNADKLNVCKVEIGPSANARDDKSKGLQIVCGGSNVRVGMKVALAQIGAKVKWHGEGDLVELKPVEIRGVPSEGMICGADEIGLIEMFPKKEEKEIVDLSYLPLTKVGAPLASVLGLDDVVFEIDNKSLSNRPDLWGHYGIAREISALFNKNLKPYTVKAIEKGKTQGSKGSQLAVEVKDKKLCSRYMGVMIDGVTIGPSPSWMQSSLLSAGVRPINIIVDITNYVMMDIGQPMHAFDAGKVTKNKEQKTTTINVRRAKDGEKMKALDGKEYSLTKDMLVIADRVKVLAIAGIMGGEESSVTDATKTVVFESANFDPVSVRKTSIALGLRSESSARFEKGLSPERAELALKKAVELTLKLCPNARVACAVVDKKNPLKKQLPMSIPLELIEKRLGMSLNLTQILSILLRLGFGVKKTKTTLNITVPLWRTKDITIVEDVIEEIIRVYGYEKIPSALPTFSIAPPEQNAIRTIEWQVKELLAYEHGFTEVYNYSFVSPETLKKIGADSEIHLTLENPIAKDRPLLRRSLKAGLLENVENNLHRFSSVKLFEIGRVFLGEKIEDGLPEQPTMLGLVYAESGAATPFFTVSQALRGMLSRLGSEVQFATASGGVPPEGGKKSSDIGPIYHPGRSAYVVVSGQKVGSIGEVHPAVAKQMGIDARVCVAEVALSALVSLLKETSSYRPVPTFPSVTRDIAFVADRNVEHNAIVSALKHVDPLIVSVELFDVFGGGNIPSGKKSMAYHIVYQDKTKTLETAQVDVIQDRVRGTLREIFSAEIR
nr:phenylalanine--tRNA ligase subunit beta [Candidatus Magasanikbacteria bacterium]